jgi:putative ABC transport system ATP-binding protein
MHRGEILVDIKGEEKEKLDTNKLLGLFEKANVTDGLSDRTLFG